jgi:ElaA protein
MIEWQWSTFQDLDSNTLYVLLQQRQQVFILEQACLYGDIDGLDAQAWHLLGWRAGANGRELVACLRYFAPGIKYPEASIGRVLTIAAARGSGIGRRLMTQALSRADALYPGQPMRIQAQHYLEAFYADFGFRRSGETYLEDGIAHVDMLR